MQWLKNLFRRGNGRHLARPAEAKDRDKTERPRLA
jgi:hypothetical protein